MRQRGCTYFVCRVGQPEHSKTQLNRGKTVRSQEVMIHHGLTGGIVVKHELPRVFPLKLVVLSGEEHALVDARCCSSSQQTCSAANFLNA